MGNIFQCCHTLSDYFKCQDTLVPGGSEQSPLLSSEESDCDSPSLPHSSEDDLTVSNGITNPSLEPENFLFPDIILSSNPGEEVTLVEPMVCLLVSEEGEECLRVDELGDEGQDKSNGGRRDRGYSEVETQTEAETQICTGVQTQTESQTEVQTQTEILKCNTETAEKEVNTLPKTGVTKQMDDLERRLKHLDVEINIKQKKERKRIISGTWADIDSCLYEATSTSINQIIKTDQNTKLQKELISDEENVFKLQNSVVTAQESSASKWMDLHPALAHLHEKNEQQNPESDSATLMLTEHKASNMDDKMDTVESHRRTKHSKTNTENVKNFKSAGFSEDLNLQDNQGDEQMAETSMLLGHKVKDYNDIHTDETTDLTILNVDQDPENREDDNMTALQGVSEMMEAVMPMEDEEGTETKQMTPFLVDRLFMAAPHIKAPGVSSCRLPVENPDDDLPQLSNDKDRKQSSLQDIVELNQTSFTVRIQPPGAESFELQVLYQSIFA